MPRAPSSGALRYQLRLERKGAGLDGYGGAAGAFAFLATVPARLAPIVASQSQEALQAAQAAGVQTVTWQVRRDPVTETLTANDRARFDFFGQVDENSPVWNISTVLPNGSSWIDIEATRAEKPSV